MGFRISLIQGLHSNCSVELGQVEYFFLEKKSAFVPCPHGQNRFFPGLYNFISRENKGQNLSVGFDCLSHVSGKVLWLASVSFMLILGISAVMEEIVGQVGEASDDSVMSNSYLFIYMWCTFKNIQGEERSNTDSLRQVWLLAPWIMLVVKIKATLEVKYQDFH